MAILGNPILLGGAKPEAVCRHDLTVYIRAAAGDTVSCWFGQADNSVAVNWGDGSGVQTYANILSTEKDGSNIVAVRTDAHSYAAEGTYILTLDALDGTSLLLGGEYYQPPFVSSGFATTIMRACALHSGSGGGIYKIVAGACTPTFDKRAFSMLTAMELYDFTACTSVPAIVDADVFYNIPEACEIRVPAALYEAWAAAEYWSDLAAHIKAG